MGAAEATKLDETFNEMERKIDLTYEAVSALTNGTNEYLQPNPGLLGSRFIKSNPLFFDFSNTRQNGCYGCHVQDARHKQGSIIPAD